MSNPEVPSDAPCSAGDLCTHLHLLVLTDQPGLAPASAVPDPRTGLPASVSPCQHRPTPPATIRRSCPKCRPFAPDSKPSKMPC